MSAENEKLKKAVSSDDAELFGRLYEQHLPGVFRYVSYRVGDRTAAEDLTSDIFNKALTDFARYNPEKAAFSTWIFTIARNTVIDYYRKRGKERKIRKETEAEIPAVAESPEDEIARNDEINRLRKCLEKLKESERELVSLKFGGGMTNREIAKITGLSESNVGTILCRVVRKLRDGFTGEQHDR